MTSPVEPDEATTSPEDDAELSGEDRYQMDQDARDVTAELSQEEQTAVLTEMRRHVEAGMSDREAWERAVAEVRGHEVPVAREGEEGALTGRHPVEARKRETYAEPGTVEADEKRRPHDVE